MIFLVLRFVCFCIGIKVRLNDFGDISVRGLVMLLRLNTGFFVIGVS